MSIGFAIAETDYLLHADPIITAYPFSVSAWVRPGNAGNMQTVFEICDKDVANQFIRLQLAGSVAGDPVRISRNDGGTGDNSDSATGYTTNTWYHIAATIANATTCTVYINGVGTAGSGVSTNFPSNPDQIAIGASRTSVPGSPYGGRIARLVVRNVELTAEEVLSEKNGTPPQCIRPGSIKCLLWMRDAGDLTSIIDGNTRTFSAQSVGASVTSEEDPPVRPWNNWSSCRGGNYQAALAAASGTPLTTKARTSKISRNRIRFYLYQKPTSGLSINDQSAVVPIIRDRKTDVNALKPDGYGNYYPKDAYDAIAHRMCDGIEAWSCEGKPWAFDIANWMETDSDAPLFRHQADAVVGGTVSASKGVQAVFSANGRSANEVIGTGIANAMVSVFASRGLSGSLSPTLMEAIWDREDRTGLDSLLGNGTTNEGWFDYCKSSDSRYGTEEIVGTQTLQAVYEGLGSPAYTAIQNKDQASNRAFTRAMTGPMRMANEWAIYEIVQAMRAVLGNFRACNYQYLTSLDPATPFYEAYTASGYRYWNSYDASAAGGNRWGFLDLGHFDLYPFHEDWATLLGVPTPSDAAGMDVLMLAGWKHNIRATRSQGRPHVATIVYAGYTSNPGSVPVDISVDTVKAGCRAAIDGGITRIVYHLPTSPSAAQWADAAEIADYAIDYAARSGGYRSRHVRGRAR